MSGRAYFDPILSLSLTALIVFPTSAMAECKIAIAVIFQDPAKNIHHDLSERELRWFKNLQKRYPDVCYSDAPHTAYSPAPNGGPPILEDSVYPSVAADIAPFVLYVTASARTYHGTKSQTTVEHSTAPVSGTATDSDGNTYHVEGDAEVTTTTHQEVPYDVDYEDLFVLVKQKQATGYWKTLNEMDRRTLCPALFGVCIGNRHPYEKLLEDSIKWLVRNQANSFDFRPERPQNH